MPMRKEKMREWISTYSQRIPTAEHLLQDGLPYYLAHSTMVLWPVCTTFDWSGNGLIQKEYSVVDP